MGEAPRTVNAAPPALRRRGRATTRAAVHSVIRCLEVLFGRGDDDYPFWLLAVRANILLFLACVALVLVWNASPARRRQLLRAPGAIAIGLGLTALAAALRFAVASANLMDHGGIAYSRLLLGYKGYFATAQFFSLGYQLTARDLEHAILFNRLAGTLTIPLVYVLCRTLLPGLPLVGTVAAFLVAVSPLHILFSASDALAIFSGFLCLASYALLAGAMRLGLRPRLAAIHYLGGFAGLTLLTQVRYENALLLLPPALVLWTRRRALPGWPLRWPLLATAGLGLFYAHAAATSGLSFQNRVDVWRGLDLVVWHLVLNPFLAIPLLLIGTAAVWVYAGRRWGALAVLPWAAAFGLAALTTDSGHGAARIYANWLILILPLAGYGFARMLAAPRRLSRAAAAAVLLCLGLQPWLMRERLAAQYLEMLEHQRFRALLENPPPGTETIVVPDDELLRRQAHSTLEVMHKYVMIRAALPLAAHPPRLLGLTEYLEHPQQANCAAGGCVFFFGMPCMAQEVYPFTEAQCATLLRTHPTALLADEGIVAAPFVDCSIYSGWPHAPRCAAALQPRRFAVYRLTD